MSQLGDSDFAAREAALDRINDDPAWAQRAYGSPQQEAVMTAGSGDKVQVPQRTANEIATVAAGLDIAIQRLQGASDKIKHHSARMQFKAADLVEQTTRLREQVLELGGDLEVVDG